ILGLNMFLNFLTEEEHRLDQSLSKDKAKATGFTGTPKLSDEQIAQLKHDLCILTNANGWQTSKINPLNSWIEIHDETEAKRISKLLKTAEVAEISMGKHGKDTRIYVVKCLNINLGLLKNKVESNNAAEAALSSAKTEVKNSPVQQ